jgi:hypothetical protein
VRQQLVSWGKVVRDYWDAVSQNARVLQTQVGRSAAIVPPDQREAVETWLKQKIART